MDDMDNFPRNLRTLTLSMSGLEEDPMPVLGKLLPQLNTLRLFAHSYEGSHMTCRSADFPNLRVLKMWKLEKLRRWKVKQGAMPKLVELEIRCCVRLGTLLSVRVFKQLFLIFFENTYYNEKMYENKCNVI